jgi:hypothetical protein
MLAVFGRMFRAETGRLFAMGLNDFEQVRIGSSVTHPRNHTALEMISISNVVCACIFLRWHQY